jgi:putative membrane protein
MKTLITIICLVLCYPVITNAQQPKKAPAKKTVKKSSAKKSNDGSLIMKAYYADLLQIELGGYAEKYAADPRVKTLASVMVRDHRRTKIELKSIASLRNMKVGDALDASHQAKADALEKKKGADFDKQYVDMLVNDHAKALAEFRRAQSSVQDKELKEFIPRALTLMQAHLESAREVQASIKGTGK